MSCTSPVINGCSAKCCENFSIPFSLENFDQMIEIIKNVDPTACFWDKDGRKITVIKDPQIQQIRDMLIYLGASKVDPQEPFVTHSEFYRFKKNLNDDDPIVVSEMDLHKDQKYWAWHFLKDGEIYSHSYTCKHFDKEKRICGNYENRPNMCINFGRGCRYEGCGFEAKRIAEEKDYNEELSLKAITESEN